MGFFFKTHSKHGVSKPHGKKFLPARSRSRVCRIEPLESRQLLSASAMIQVGATYLEDCNGDEVLSFLQGTTTQVADIFQVGYASSAQNTQLTKLVINLGEATIFDVASGDSIGTDADGSFGLKVLSYGTNDGHDGFQIDWSKSGVSADGSQLVLYVSGWDAGETLVFTVDVDEGDSPTADGGELDGTDYGKFQLPGASLVASFVTPGMEDRTTDPIDFHCYENRNDEFFEGTDLYGKLPDKLYSNDVAQAYTPDSRQDAGYQPVNTACAYASVEQKPLSSISGYVYEDLNGNGQYDAGEGLSNFTVTLYDSGNNVVNSYTTKDADDGYYIFKNLADGTYQVVETQRSQYADVRATTEDGMVSTVNDIRAITVDSQDSVNNNFVETQFSIDGHVYYDADGDGRFDAGEGIAGVTVTLYNAKNEPIASHTTTTADDGYYKFDDLGPDTYRVVEGSVAALGYLEGNTYAGTILNTEVGDDLVNNTISSILLDDRYTTGATFDNSAENYDFTEVLATGISGRVFVDSNGNSKYDTGETILSKVTVYLLDASGKVIDTTTTGTDGMYDFTGLKPGAYSVVEISNADAGALLAAYLEGGTGVEYTSGGTPTGVNSILNVTLAAGVSGFKYDFYELLPATISGYVFQDGSTLMLQSGEAFTNPNAYGYDGRLTSDDTRLSTGVTLYLYDGEGNLVTTTSPDANGYYKFTGLYAGSYSIVARFNSTAYAAYYAGVDTVGTNGGTAANTYNYSTLDAATLSQLAALGVTVDVTDRTILQVTVATGQSAEQYNFSEVLVQSSTTPPVVPPTEPPTFPEWPTPEPYVPPEVYWGSYAVAIEQPPTLMSGGAGGPGGYSWHLSVIDAGQPRADISSDGLTSQTDRSLYSAVSWSGGSMDQGEWVLADENGNPIKRARFGRNGAIPVTGDWNGSGVTKVGVFLAGQWFLDLDGDGVWDNVDLWAKLGKAGDQPVSGDWNGDGKTDIGIYGQAWVGDIKAILAEPGLPDAQNPPTIGRPKNVPPDPADAAVDRRIMKKGDTGSSRTDVIDHVFEYGTKGDRAVTGDWNGDGIYTVGVFRGGRWFLDMDGDGRWSDGDLTVDFGQEGDLPVVGDWTGDGVSKLGVFRNGKFILDTNNNHQIDATDKVFELGQAGDRPVVGDWTGNGVDKVGVYHDGGGEAPLQAARSTATR
ncbi:MAG: SdrD B-like domain-containing protein [Thermoguttaceae bacterium]